MSFRTAIFQRRLAWAVLASETTHVFCCLIPTVVTMMSVLASLGAIAQVPTVLLDFHEFMHHYEIPVIAFSGGMLVLGWALYAISKRIECHKPHCEPHETVCAPQKDNSRTVLIVASAIFLINVTVYLTVHVGVEHHLHEQAVAAHAHDHHH